MRISPKMELQNKTNLGIRAFERNQLRTTDLTYADLRDLDLSYVDLSEMDLSHADLRGACLDGANLKQANLEGASLQGASLVKAVLTKANLQKANLTDANLKESFLTYANLSKALLNGACLDNAYLSGANLKGAYYSNKTIFPVYFNPLIAKMEKSSTVNVDLNNKITVMELLNTINELSKCSTHYLGTTLTARYLESSRPKEDWLKNFQVAKNGEVTFQGNFNDFVSTVKLNWFQAWLKSFIKECSLIIQDFPIIIEQKRLGLK